MMVFFFSFDFSFCISHRAGGLQWLLDSGKVYCILGENVFLEALGEWFLGKISSAVNQGGEHTIRGFSSGVNVTGV